MEYVPVMTDDDWETLRHREATTVLDPMVVRVADVFLQGQSGSPTGWKLVHDNLETLASFFDALILEPGLAVFDYGLTGTDWQTSDQIRLIEVNEEVMTPVGVDPQVWGPFVSETVGKMRQIPLNSAEVTQQIATQLRRAGWTFLPRFGGSDYTGHADDGTDQRLVNSYLYVSLLLSRYASRLSDDGRLGTQVLSPSQSSALVTLMKEGGSRIGSAEDEVNPFTPLESVLNRSLPGFERTIRFRRLYFLPYLLSFVANGEVRTPEELCLKALKLRRRSDVRDYRDKLAEISRQIETGFDPHTWRRDLQRTSQAVERSLRIKPSTLNLNLDIGMSGPRLGIDTEVETTSIRDWLMAVWPGRRYRRVLTRLAKAQEECKQIERPVNELWRAA